MATIAKRASGRWQAKIRRFGLPAISKTFRTKADAVAWASVQESEFERGVWKDRSVAESTTLRSILEKYLSVVVPQKRGAATETARINTLIRDSMSSVRLASLTGAMLARWRDERLQAGAKGSTVNRELNLLSSVFNWARRDLGIAFENPVQDISRPPQPKHRERRLLEGELAYIDRALSDEDGQKTLSSGKHYRMGARNPLMKPLVRFALETGMRQSEIVKLRREHVNLKKRTARLLITKNGESRDVPLSSTAVEVLSSLPNDDERAFPLSSEAVKRSWRRTVLRARAIYEADCRVKNVEPNRWMLRDLTFHDLRHEATSRLAEKLSNVLELAAVTGHKDLRSLKRYYHPRAEDLAKKLG